MNELFIKLILPSLSPNLNSPEDEKNIPLPDVNVGFVPNCNVPTVESLSNLSVCVDLFQFV